MQHEIQIMQDNAINTEFRV